MIDIDTARVILEIALLATTSVIVLVLLLRARSTRETLAAVTRVQADLGHIGQRLDAQSQSSESRLHTLERSVRASNAGLREDTHTSVSALESVLAERLLALDKQLQAQHTQLEQRHSQAQEAANETLRNGLEATQRQVAEALARGADDLGKRVDALTRSTDQRLAQIGGQVEQRLSEGFDKTRQTFADVLKRLALIDAAQAKITELSSNVVSLQAVLADKQARGAFGEVQLGALVRDMLPAQSFALQHRLSNGRIADCVLFLPSPSGNVAIDAKFPLEAYRTLRNPDLGAQERKLATRQFKLDVKRHLSDIRERYIVPGETAEGAVMFIPAEAVFAEIQAHHADLVSAAHELRVWMVSPTTMMAILNTARAVLKDEATRKQVDLIRVHLSGLATDFERFQKRMHNLARHIKLAHKDVDEVNVSARAISSRFERIEAVELSESDAGAGLPEQS
ncbi:MAG: DNA recombination protein RmuC [Gammaproteobacteria bacterium]